MDLAQASDSRTCYQSTDPALTELVADDEH